MYLSTLIKDLANRCYIRIIIIIKKTEKEQEKKVVELEYIIILLNGL